MKEKNNIYVVVVHKGSYDSAHSKTVGVFDDIQQATLLKTNIEANAELVKKNAPIVTDEDDDSDLDYIRYCNKPENELYYDLNYVSIDVFDLNKSII